MDHTYDNHKRCVNQLCRICANLCVVTLKQKKNNNRIYNCDKFAFDIYTIYGVEVHKESDDQFSKFMCHKCFACLKNIKASNSVNVLTKARERFQTTSLKWCAFDEDNSVEECVICTHRYGLKMDALSTVNM